MANNPDQLTRRATSKIVLTSYSKPIRKPAQAGRLSDGIE
jgi:hypothetical protein